MNVSQHAPQVTAVPPMLYDTAVTIDPAHPDDVPAILDMHQRLSSNSLYLRYLVPYVPAYIPGPAFMKMLGDVTFVKTE